MKKLLLFMMLLVTSITSWAEDPYFEVISGSFASGNVTVKFTFPEATTVSFSGSIYLAHNDKPNDVYVTASGSDVSTEGNTLTAIFTYTPWAGISESGYSFWSGGITAEGYSQYSNIHAKPVPPYAEVLSGSLTSGTLAVKVTFPNISTIEPDLGYSYTISLWNNDVKLDAKTSSGDVSVTGNTLSTTFNFSTQSDDDLSATLIKVDKWAIKLDGAWNVAMEISFSSSTPEPSGCEHANCTSHPAVEPTESTPGNIAYDECDDCGLFFAATDTEHTTPLEWSAIELTYCAHEHVGADDICADCNRVLPHAPRTMTWTVNGITVTYNKAVRSLTFSGEGTMPDVDLYSLAEDQKIAKLIEAYPWYGALNPRLESDWMGTHIVVDAVSTLTIESGVHIGSGSDATQYIVAGVFYDHTTYEWHLNADVIVVDNDDAKAPYSYHSHVHTPADLASMGVTSFPSEVFWSMGDHYHVAQYTKEPECPYYSSYNLYCPVCGYYSNGGSAWSSEQVKHDYNYAGVCYNCGAKNPATCAHTNVNSYAAVASTDTYHGHIAFKKCSDCGQYFAADDASCATALDFETQVLLPLAAPSCSHVMNEMTPVCNGVHTVYYACELCGHLFADAEGETEISEADVTHDFEGDVSQCTHGCGAYNPATCEHEMVHHYRVEPSCGEYGMEEHDECTICGELFDSYSNPTTIEALRINKLTHEFNSYNVCVNCGYETPEALHTCSHINMTWLGDSRTSCTQTFGYKDYYRCNNCDRYRAYDDKLHTTVTILKSDMQITPGSQLHNGHLAYKSADPLSCTQSALAISRKECSDCHRMYYTYTPDDECLISNAWTEGFINSMLSSPVGHNFVDGSHVCSRCGFDAVYRKVTVDSEIKAGAHYILVSHIGDQYYAFGKPGYDENRDSNMGYLGFDAVPVNMEPDGRISVTSNKVMTLYTYGILSNVFDNNNITADGLRQRVMDLTFYNPVYGDIRWDIADANIFEKNKDLVLDEVSLWNADETESMNLHIYNGEKKFYARWNYTYPVDDYRYPEYGSNLVEDGALIYSMADWFGSYFKRFHTMILGQNGSDEPRFHVPGFMNFIPGSDETQYEKIYPVCLYLLDTKKFINAENTTAANVSGPVTKEDVMSIFTKAKDSYDENVAALAELAEKYPDPYTEYKVLKSSYQFTTIDLSKARISDGDLTYQDIMDMKNNEFSAPNVIIVLPETSGASAVKGKKPSMKSASQLASIPNVIINGSCQTLVLQDKQTMNVPVDFTAGNVTYFRDNVTSQWGTLCLPYAISSDENVQLYKLSEVDNEGAEGVMTFTPIAEAEAGQPVVFKKLDADATELSFDKEDAELTIAGFNGATTDLSKWELVGTYEQAKIKSDKDFGRYYIAQNKFWNSKVEATVPAFRAWFENDKSNDAAARANYIILIEEDEEVIDALNVAPNGELEECTEIYDLGGRKLAAPVKGQINIINGKNIFVK